MARPTKAKDGTTRDTRNEILDAAMGLFATRGFSATTVKEIAARVGIRDASLYNHFASKRVIFDAIIERELAHLKDTLQASNALFDINDDPHAYLTHNVEDLESAVLESYRPFFENVNLICLRKMLTVNQFEDERAGELYQTIFIEQPLRIQTTIFERLVAEKKFMQCNTRLAAYEFHGPVFILLSQNLTWNEAMPRIRSHLRAFERTHRA